LPSHRFEREIQEQIDDANRKFRVGQVTAIVGSKLTVTVDGATLTISRCASWTPAVNDIVLIATTQVGWIAICKVLP
jgi:hypothetical protein